MLTRQTRMSLGLATGLAMGLLFWQALDNLALGISLGLVFALTMGLAPGEDVEAGNVQAGNKQPPKPG